MEGKRAMELEQENQKLKERISALEQELMQCRLRLEHLTRKADLDYLTGVWNREGISRMISSSLDNSGGQAGALCFLDLDNFKQINDRFGHTYGDEALCAIAQALKEGICDSDVVGRFGGDEFLIFMSGVADEADILERAEAICGRIRKLPLNIPLTASIGIARCPEHGSEFQELLDKADSALYQSKCAGKDRIRFFIL